MRLEKKPRRIWGGWGGTAGQKSNGSSLSVFFRRHDHNSYLRNWLHQLYGAGRKKRPIEPGGSDARTRAVARTFSERIAPVQKYVVGHETATQTNIFDRKLEIIESAKTKAYKRTRRLRWRGG